MDMPVTCPRESDKFEANLLQILLAIKSTASEQEVSALNRQDNMGVEELRGSAPKLVK